MTALSYEQALSEVIETVATRTGRPTVDLGPETLLRDIFQHVSTLDLLGLLREIFPLLDLPAVWAFHADTLGDLARVAAGAAARRLGPPSAGLGWPVPSPRPSSGQASPRRRGTAPGSR